jgi:hypothetical protein
VILDLFENEKSDSLLRMKLPDPLIATSISKENRQQRQRRDHQASNSPMVFWL